MNFAAFVDRRLGGDRAKLIRKTGLSKGRITQLFDQKEPFGERAAAKLTDALGLPAGYFERPDPLEDPQSPEVVPPFGGPQSGVTLTQELSRLRPTMDPPTIEWGDTLHAKLPPRFILALPDDALAPDFPAGTRISWSTEKPPRVGSVVLVRDQHGQAHAREYTQGRAPGQWIAAPTGRAFASLDGAEITLLAVAEFEYRPLP